MKNQPKGLYSLSMTELWERFGFYTIQTILLLYMSHGMNLPDKEAYLLYGVFSSMIYLTPVLGGYIADRYLGFQRSIVLGAILLAGGYFCMGISGLFFWGMSLAILGNGFFKPNVSGIVGSLYTKDDPRRETGFTIFYMGINIGALLPPLFTGTVVHEFGWLWGFFIASFGMLIAIAIFLYYRRYYKTIGLVPARSPLHKGVAKSGIVYFGLLGGIVIALGAIRLLFSFPEEMNLVMIAATALIVSVVLYFLFKEGPQQRKKLFACLILLLISFGFWAIYMQTYTSLMLFADRNMQKEFLGFTIDAEFTQFFNPFFILLLGPILNTLWIKLDRTGKNPSMPAKFTWGLFSMAIGFFFLSFGAEWFGSATGISSPWWLVGSYFFQTTGELLLSPIGLSMITRLAPPHLTGMMMGVWFLTLSAGMAAGANLATFADVPKGVSSIEALHIYADAFLYYGFFALIVALISLCLIRFVKKLIKAEPDAPQTPKV